MRILVSGMPAMEKVLALESVAVGTVRSDLPFYSVEPTDALRNKIKWKNWRNILVRNALAMVFGFPLLAISLLSTLGILTSLSDVIMGFLSAGFSEWLNTLLLSRDWILEALIASSIFNIFLQFATFALLMWADYSSRHIPGIARNKAESQRNRNTKKYPNLFSRAFHVAILTFRGAVSAVIIWSLILYAMYGLGYSVFLPQESGHTISLRGSIFYGFTIMLDWALRGNNFLGISTYINALPNVPTGLLSLGTTIKIIALTITPLAIASTITRFWRLSAPENIEDE